MRLIGLSLQEVFAVLSVQVPLTRSLLYFLVDRYRTFRGVDRENLVSRGHEHLVERCC